MIKQRFIVDKYYWKVYVYYNVTKNDVEVVLNKLKELKLPTSYIKSAYTILNSNKQNQGITQTNVNLRTTVIVISKTSSSSEFVNSFVHEIVHLTNHIALYYNLDLTKEDVCYLAGDIAQEMYKICHTLMCDYCREGL